MPLLGFFKSSEGEKVPPPLGTGSTRVASLLQVSPSEKGGDTLTLASSPAASPEVWTNVTHLQQGRQLCGPQLPSAHISQFVAGPWRSCHRVQPPDDENCQGLLPFRMQAHEVCERKREYGVSARSTACTKPGWRLRGMSGHCSVSQRTGACFVQSGAAQWLTTKNTSYSFSPEMSGPPSHIRFRRSTKRGHSITLWWLFLVVILCSVRQTPPRSSHFSTAVFFLVENCGHFDKVLAASVDHGLSLHITPRHFETYI